MWLYAPYYFLWSSIIMHQIKKVPGSFCLFYLEYCVVLKLFVLFSSWFILTNLESWIGCLLYWSNDLVHAFALIWDFLFWGCIDSRFWIRRMWLPKWTNGGGRLLSANIMLAKFDQGCSCFGRCKIRCWNLFLGFVSHHSFEKIFALGSSKHHRSNWIS